MPSKPATPPPRPFVQGPINAVPCPHCGKPQDFRPIQEQQLLDTGSMFNCEECGWSQEVVSVQSVTIVAVRKDPTRNGPGPVGEREAAPARAVGPGFVQRLLNPQRRR